MDQLLICFDERFPSYRDPNKVFLPTFKRITKPCKSLLFLLNRVDIKILDHKVHLVSCDFWFKYAFLRSILTEQSGSDPLFQAILSHFQIPISNTSYQVFQSIQKRFQLVSNVQNPSERVVLIYIQFQPVYGLCSIEPDLPWARRATRLVHNMIALVTANAYVSTLGGGHFLCKQLKKARFMARLQMAIASGLGDPHLKGYCKVHLAYNAIQTGEFQTANRIIHRVRKAATCREDSHLVNVCVAAQIYLRKTYGLYKTTLNTPLVKDHLQDNFYRQRIVR